ncbi:transmembrane protein 144-like [Branchiostoma floridae]|uniref:Transmembrane protein 144-like n=1 Tax=Branchiostoma floridae TaxID=7739 RepID=A0A9J7LFP7_BRAFL|nr:transmembrane protein 144-like [Branchiostoma floridae]
MSFFFRTDRNYQNVPLHLRRSRGNDSTTTSASTFTAAYIQPSNFTKDEAYIGFIAAAVSCVFFGTTLVPVKRVDTGDGMFFQWVFCSAVWCVGLVVNVIQGLPKFYAISMIGGALWCTGNIVVVPILKTIGLGMGMLFWASTNLLMGWFSGRFGWFGMRPDKLTRPALDYAGVALGIVRTIILSFVKSDVMDKPGADNEPLLEEHRIQANINSPSERLPSSEHEDYSWVDKLSPVKKRITGITLAMFSGCMYGLNFVPVIYAQQHYEGATDNGLDYVFAHFSGIYATSTLYFLLYCMYMRNKPAVFPRAILPALLSGTMRAIAQAAWFVANQRLQESVSFPIITTGPSLVGTLWSVFYFREIKGIRNAVILAAVFAVTITGALLTSFSF